MTIALRGTATTAATSNAATTLAVNAPTGLAAGDVCLIWVSCSGNPTVTPPTGFKLGTQVANGSNFANVICYRMCNGTEASTFTVTFNTAKDAALVCIAYSGVAVNTPFDPILTTPVANTTASTAITANGLTTLGPSEQLVWFGCSLQTAAGTPPTITVPSTYTARCTQINSTNTASGINVGAIVADKAQATAGTIAGPAGTLSLSKASTAQLTALATTLDTTGVI